jgi:transcriptional regulator with XRE-family HTH domain
MSEKHGDKYLQLGLNIAYYRKMRGLNQETLADMVGISRTHISNIEAPKVDKSLSLEVLFDIADALKVSVSKLFELR